MGEKGQFRIIRISRSLTKRNIEISASALSNICDLVDTIVYKCVALHGHIEN